MTDPSCPECHRPKASPHSAFYRSLSRHHREEYCANCAGPNCRDATIRRLRAALAAAQALAPGEGELVAALDDVSYLRRDYAHESEEHQQMFDRIKAALRAKGELEAAERAVIEGVIAWRHKDLALECKPGCGCLDVVADAADELLALRAKAGR